jgi:uncharacterized coiled-coil protein SlyX
MEDQERDVGAVERQKSKVKGRSKGDDRLTIMILKRAGKVRTVKASLRLLMGASLFLLIYIVVTIFLTNAYFSAARTTTMQADTIAALTGELAKTQETLERSRQYIVLLSDYLKEGKEQTPEPMAAVDCTESSFPKAVDINDLEVKRDRSALQVHFKIVNTQPHEEPIGGYIFVLVRVKGSEDPEIWAYPNAVLKNGKPIDYRHGHRFFIQRFRTITGNYTLNKEIDAPLILEILVYDRDGGLILKKVVEV